MEIEVYESTHYKIVNVKFLRISFDWKQSEFLKICWRVVE